MSLAVTCQHPKTGMQIIEFHNPALNLMGIQDCVLLHGHL